MKSPTLMGVVVALDEEGCATKAEADSGVEGSGGSEAAVEFAQESAGGCAEQYRSSSIPINATARPLHI